MAKLDRYDPPGYLEDFAAIPGQLEAWSAAVSGWFDGNIELAREKLHAGDLPQFYNALTDDPAGPVFDQPLVWNGLPGTYRNRYGRTATFALADELLPLTRRMDGPGSYYVGPAWENLVYRPQDEYCEWHVTRDATGKIARIAFTSEPPEYWRALHGDRLQDANGNWRYDFPGDRNLLLALYRSLVSPEVQYEDLICHGDLYDYTDPAKPQLVFPKGAYNPYNRWNTTDGIVHLTHPANSLVAEINLGATATVLRANGPFPITDPDALICAAHYGGPNRASDPTIGSSVNELAALGAAVTLRNPVGLAMHHLDLAGFETPRGEPVPEEFFRVVRGDRKDGLIERGVLEVPEGEGYVVGDITIGGMPITYGGQVAERMTVNLVGRACAIGSFHNTPVPPESFCCQDQQEAGWLYFPQQGTSCPPTALPAFAYAGPVPAGLAAARVSKPVIGRHLTRVV